MRLQLSYPAQSASHGHSGRTECHQKFGPFADGLTVPFWKEWVSQTIPEPGQQSGEELHRIPAPACQASSPHLTDKASPRNRAQLLVVACIGGDRCKVSDLKGRVYKSSLRLVIARAAS